MAKLHRISEASGNPQRKADVVFIHGLGGDAFGTWQHGDNPDKDAWPYWLARDFPDVGVWSLSHAADPSMPLGFIARLLGKGGRDAGQGMSLPDRAGQVIDQMRLDPSFPSEHPIVFVCHSLGGLLAKQILRKARDNAGTNPQNISRRAAAVLFLATPHHGAALASLANAFAAICGPTASLAALKADDPHLRDLYNWYRKHAIELDIATETYFESRDVAGFRIVDETSSQPGVGPDAVMLDEDHLSIAKPREHDAQVCLALDALLRTVLARKVEPLGRDVEHVKPVAVTTAVDSPYTAFHANVAPRIAPLPSPVPPNLRLADYGYFGRSHEQAQLLQRLRNPQIKASAVVGGAGLGKTALVAKVLRTLLGDSEDGQWQALARSPFPDGIVFLDLYALHGQADPAWEALADAVSPQVMEEGGSTRVIPSRERAIAACRGKRFLLVVEGGEEARGTIDAEGHVRTTRRDLLEPIELQGPVLWLTRNSAQSNASEWVRIDNPLDIGDAGDLFDAIAGAGVSSSVRDEVLSLLHGHPLAITWMAALVAREDEPPDLLLGDLRKQPSLLLLNDPEQPHRTLKWLFDRSLQGLDEAARRSLLAAGLLGSDAFPAEAIAAGTGLDALAQREALKASVQAHFLRWQIDVDGALLWRFGHALTYGYAREQVCAAPDTVLGLLSGLAEWVYAEMKAGLTAQAPIIDKIPRTLTHAQALLATDESLGLWRPLVHAMLYKFSDRFVALGQLTRAVEVREAVARWLVHACNVQPETSRWQRETAACHDRQGNLDLARGELSNALRHHEAGLIIIERLAAQDPTNNIWQRDLSVSHIKIGDVQGVQGDLPSAQGHYEDALAITRLLVASDPSNSDWQRDLSVSHSKLGDVQEIQGNLPAAQRHYEASLGIIEPLVAVSPENIEWLRDLSVSFEKLGNVQQAQMDLQGAQRHYEAGLVIAERLAEKDPANAGWQRDLSISHSKLGEVQQAQSDFLGAQRHYEADFVIAERLALQDPSNADWQRDLSISHEKLGDVKQAQGDMNSARRHYEAARAILERLSARDLSNASWQRDLAEIWTKLAGICKACGDAEGSFAHLQTARMIMRILCQRAPDHQGFQRELIVIERLIAEQ